MIEDKNPADTIGLTPLHSAAAKGHFSICDLILENVEEKDPKTKHDNGQGRTPYDFAKSNGHFKICQLVKNFKDKVDHHLQMLARGDFYLEDYEFYEEITDESDANWETSEDKVVYLELFKGDVENLETIDGSKAIARNCQYLPDDDKHIEMLLEEDNVLREEFDETIMDKSDAELKKIEGDVENMETIEGFEAFARIFQHRLEFYEEITDESDTNWETTNNKEVQSEISKGDVKISKTLDKVDQHMELLEGDDFNVEDYEFHEEITDESDADCETTEDKEVQSEISKGDLEISETIHKVDQPMEMLEGDDWEITEGKEVHSEMSNGDVDEEFHSEISKGDVEISENIDKLDQPMEMLEGENWKINEVKGVHSEVSKVDVEILETIDKVDQPMEMHERDDFRQENNEIHSEIADEYIEIPETIDGSDAFAENILQHMEMLEGNYYDQEDDEFYE